jgi:hypothetical protein
MADSTAVVRRRINDVEVVMIVGVDGFDVALDVEVHTKQGETYHGTFLTLEMIAERLAYYRLSGECAGGRYFWCSSMIVVAELSQDAVLAVVADLVESDELCSAMKLSLGSDAK